MDNAIKPRVFIGSSREGMAITDAIHTNLTRVAECTPWHSAFQLSSSTLNELIRNLRSNDFGIFVFSPDDVLTMRNTTHSVARDNVIFELGLFIGRLGQDRCYFLIPDNATNLHLPSDLAGVTPAYYEGSRSDNNWVAALAPACSQIKAQMEKLKTFQDAAPIENIATPPNVVKQNPSLQSEVVTPISNTSSSTVDLTIEPYKKCYLIKGETKKHKEALKSFGAKWNDSLGGWVIQTKDKDKFEADFSSFI